LFNIAYLHFKWSATPVGLSRLVLSDFAFPSRLKVFVIVVVMLSILACRSNRDKTCYLLPCDDVSNCLLCRVCSLHTMTREKKENTSDLTQWLKNVLERLQKTDPKGFDKLVTAAA
jgi:hypothetical protein